MCKMCVQSTRVAFPDLSCKNTTGNRGAELSVIVG